MFRRPGGGLRFGGKHRTVDLNWDSRSVREKNQKLAAGRKTRNGRWIYFKLSAAHRTHRSSRSDRGKMSGFEYRSPRRGQGVGKGFVSVRGVLPVLRRLNNSGQKETPDNMRGEIHWPVKKIFPQSSSITSIFSWGIHLPSFDQLATFGDFSDPNINI